MPGTTAKITGAVRGQASSHISRGTGNGGRPSERTPGVSCCGCGDGHRLQTAEGKASIASGSPRWTVFGVIKEVLGFRRFHLRGLRGAEGEWSPRESEADVCPGRRISGVSRWPSCGAGMGAGDTLEGVAGVTPSRRASIPPRGPVWPPDYAQPSAGEPAGRLRRSPGLAHFVTPRPRLRQTPRWGRGSSRGLRWPPASASR